MRKLLPIGLAALLLSCSSGSGSRGAQSGASSGSAASSGGSSSSGSTPSSGGSSSSGSTPSSGGSSSSGSTPSSGGSSSSGSASSSGSSSGSGPSSGDDGGAGQEGGSGGLPPSMTCTNPSHVLPLNPSNAQDGITLSGFYVDTDTWNAMNYPVTQTMYVCDYDNWYVVANMNNDSGDGAVKTYPNVHMDFGSAPKISSFSTISSSFAHTAPHVGIYEFAYDMWLNGVATNGSTEVMIWTDNYNQVPLGSSMETVTFDGQTYNVYKSGSYIAFVETNNVTSGTVDLLSFFNHVIQKGWIVSSSTVGAIDYGVELVSTNSMSATFAVNDFSLTTN
jgi:hypothetical protein